MTNSTTPKLGTPQAELHAALHSELRNPIASNRQRLAGAVNAELTRLYRAVGERLRTEVLGGADRAKYGREQVELLQMHKDGITLAECWTELPPKAELEKKLQADLPEARERLVRRGVLLGTRVMSYDMKACKGLAFHVVALAGVGLMPAKGAE